MTKRPLETVGAIIEHYLRVALERDGLNRLNPEVATDVKAISALLTEAEEANAMLAEEVAVLDKKVTALEELVAVLVNEREGK